MYEPKIILSGAPNARDLGGIETKDGRTLKYGRLICSGVPWGTVKYRLTPESVFS